MPSNASVKFNIVNDHVMDHMTVLVEINKELPEKSIFG